MAKVIHLIFSFMRGFLVIVGRLLTSILLLSVCYACSIKENRESCPVYVTVLVDRFVQQGFNDGGISYSSGRDVKRSDISFLSHLREGHTCPCPRDYASVSVVAGMVNSSFRGDTLYVSKGREADPIWSYGESFVSKDEEYLVDAVPHKQYCKVKFSMDGSELGGDYPWRFRIKAACNAIDLVTSKPIKGDYETIVGPNHIDEWTTIIPRQMSNNMIMEIFLPNEGSQTDGRVDAVVDLGKMFEEKGYDWTAANLADVELRVGFAFASLSISIIDWEQNDKYINTEI